MNYAQYVDFWRTVAGKHIEIRHTPTEKHFVRVVLTNDPILSATAQLGEFLTGMRSKLLMPAMVLVAYTSNYGDEDGDAVSKDLAGRIIILDDPAKADYDDEEQILFNTERIGEECLAYAKNYFDENPEAGFFEFRGGGTDMLANIGGRQLYGTGLDFTMHISHHPGLIYKPDQFTV